MIYRILALGALAVGLAGISIPAKSETTGVKWEEFQPKFWFAKDQMCGAIKFSGIKCALAIIISILLTLTPIAIGISIEFAVLKTLVSHRIIWWTRELKRCYLRGLSSRTSLLCRLQVGRGICAPRNNLAL